MSVYEQPVYYEIAFSFVDSKKQADLFEKFIKKFSRIKVKRILDIGCGPSLQLREIAKRGYEAIGVDLSPEMLRYLDKKSKEEGIIVQTLKADKTNFCLAKKVDFAFIMMGSFVFSSNEELLKHLDCVSNSLKRGGLYLIENLCLDWPRICSKPQSWIMERDGIKIKTTYEPVLRDALSQTYEEKITLEVDDNGKKSNLSERHIWKYVFPQEFVSLLQLNSKFEFLGWFERFRLKRLNKPSLNNTTVLRKK